MACFADLPYEVRVQIHEYVLIVAKIFPYQNGIPVDKNGVVYDLPSYGWIMAMARLGPNYRKEAEEVLWSKNLVVFNGYTVRRFFSTLDQLAGISYEAKVLSWLRANWIKKVSINFSNTDRHYLYTWSIAGTVPNICDGTDFTSVLRLKPFWMEDASEVLMLLEHWRLQARFLARLYLDRLEVDVENARCSINACSMAHVGYCGLVQKVACLVHDYANAREVVVMRARCKDEGQKFYEILKGAAHDDCGRPLTTSSAST